MLSSLKLLHVLPMKPLLFEDPLARVANAFPTEAIRFFMILSPQLVVSVANQRKKSAIYRSLKKANEVMVIDKINGE